MHSNSFPVTPTVVALIVGSDSLQLLLWVQVCLMEWGHVEPSLYSCISAIMLLIAEVISTSYIGILYILHREVRMTEWSKAPDSSSGPLTRAWVQIPLLTTNFFLYQKCLSS
ncbi:hypothetical protein V6N13_014221 [Hibiscus sabdariffa]